MNMSRHPSRPTISMSLRRLALPALAAHAEADRCGRLRPAAGHGPHRSPRSRPHARLRATPRCPRRRRSEPLRRPARRRPSARSPRASRARALGPGGPGRATTRSRRRARRRIAWRSCSWTPTGLPSTNTAPVKAQSSDRPARPLSPPELGRRRARMPGSASVQDTKKGIVPRLVDARVDELDEGARTPPREADAARGAGVRTTRSKRGQKVSCPTHGQPPGW